MPRNKQPLTTLGKTKIEQELAHLITVERETLKKTIAEARAQGDLSENADYQYAKEKQAHVEGRIMYLQGVLANAEVIDISSIKSNKIVFGATVNLIDVEQGTTIRYQIVGNDEANTAQKKISIDSPLGKALIGKESGDTVIVNAPKGDIEYEIESFEFINR